MLAGLGRRRKVRTRSRSTKTESSQSRSIRRTHLGDGCEADSFLTWEGSTIRDFLPLFRGVVRLGSGVWEAGVGVGAGAGTVKRTGP